MMIQEPIVTNYRIIGIISDTHIGNENSALEELNIIYDIFEENGVEAVFHAGDITD